MIEKGSVRLGYETFMARMMNYSFLFTELCCITPSTVKKVLARYEGVSQVPGYGELSADQQREVREYFKSLEGEEDEVEDEHEAMENT